VNSQVGSFAENGTSGGVLFRSLSRGSYSANRREKGSQQQTKGKRVYGSSRREKISLSTGTKGKHQFASGNYPPTGKRGNWRSPKRKAPSTQEEIVSYSGRTL